MMVDIKKKLVKNFHMTYCRIQPSKISGVGVFAIRDIPLGVNPFSVVKKERWFRLKKKELRGVDKEVAKMIKDFYVIESDGSIWISDFCLNGMNISYFLNHSKTPNTLRKESGEYFTLRLIKQGEELTTDYSDFDQEYSKKVALK